jgi:hypothetical protein
MIRTPRFKFHIYIVSRHNCSKISNMDKQPAVSRKLLFIYG